MSDDDPLGWVDAFMESDDGRVVLEAMVAALAPMRFGAGESERFWRAECEAVLRAAMLANDDVGGSILRWREWPDLVAQGKERAEAAEAENDLLWKDATNLLHIRNLALEEASLDFQPGPDGQDDLDRAAHISRWVAAAHERHEDGELTYPETQAVNRAKLDAQRAEAERDALRDALVALTGNMNEHGSPNKTAAYYASVDSARRLLAPGVEESPE